MEKQISFVCVILRPIVFFFFINNFSAYERFVMCVVVLPIQNAVLYSFIYSHHQNPAGYRIYDEASFNVISLVDPIKKRFRPTTCKIWLKSLSYSVVILTNLT